MAVCGITLADKLVKEFVATVAIPAGFIIDTNPESLHKYETYLSIDKSAVFYIAEEQVHSSVITVPDLNNPGQTMELPCQSRMRALKLKGPLFYNSVISGFIPASQMDPEPTGVIISAPTAFTSSNVVPINDVIGYACYECELPPFSMSGFDVKIIQDTEYVITNTGATIPHNEEHQAEFFAAFTGNSSQMVYIHYTIVVTPKVVTP